MGENLVIEIRRPTRRDAELPKLVFEAELRVDFRQIENLDLIAKGDEAFGGRQHLALAAAHRQRRRHHEDTLGARRKNLIGAHRIRSRVRHVGGTQPCEINFVFK
ncbi:MAG: hypothetical protein ACJ8EU_08485 [Xanthobacteraceae bacterium]